jgi:hypothetical protein
MERAGVVVLRSGERPGFARPTNACADPWLLAPLRRIDADLGDLAPHIAR